jgi:uncharacterized protein YjbK
MKEKLEIEYKTLLNHNQATYLLSTGLFEYLGKQQNVYVDTDNYFFGTHKTVLRIRTRKDTHVFTAKIETNEGLKEIEFDINDNRIDNPRIIEFIKEYTQYSDIIKIGSTITYRYIFNDEFGQWCLDFNVFKYTSDVELEYELNEGLADKKAHFLEFLKKWNIPYSPCPSKFVRLLNEISE